MKKRRSKNRILNINSRKLMAFKMKGVLDFDLWSGIVLEIERVYRMFGVRSAQTPLSIHAPILSGAGGWGWEYSLRVK